MDFGAVELLLERNHAWKLLRTRNAALTLSFLGTTYVDQNSGPVPSSQLTSALEDHLYAVNRGRAELEKFKSDAASYLDDWASPESGWLRRFYPASSEEVHYDATPALEKAYAWVASLKERSFVGTESRLHTLVELLRQIAHGSEEDPATRLATLEHRRAAIDREIDEVTHGNIAVLDGASLRDRYQLFTSTARELLSDFREVEENFRTLDRAARERIAVWNGAKGELLEDLVGDRTDITASDQGRSFQAFYDFLLSQTRQDELSDLVARVQALEAIDTDERMRTVHFDWFDAAERTQQTVRQLSEQLRRFLDDQIWLENRRVLDLVRSIEAHAIAARDAPVSVGLEVDADHIPVALPFERPLYDVKPPVEVDSLIADSDGEEIDTSALYSQTFVDQARLANNIRSVVPPRSSILLTDLLELYPVEDGVAEIVGYLALTDDDLELVPDEENRVVIDYHDRSGHHRRVQLPAIEVHRA